jgi:hypothetical protein
VIPGDREILDAASQSRRLKWAARPGIVAGMKRNVPEAGVAVIASGLIVLGAWAGTPQSAHPAGPLPTPFPEARYQQLSARSPFALASAPVAAAAATPDFAAQLYVTGVADIGGDDFVSIKTRQPQDGKPAEVFLEVGGTTGDGMKVERVKWSDQMGKTTVDVSKAGEKATLAFDEDTVKTAPPVQPGAPVARTMMVRLPGGPGLAPRLARVVAPPQPGERFPVDP